jgi:hypothetical protein
MKCRVDRHRKKKVFDWVEEHKSYVAEWDLQGDNLYDNEEPHTNREFRQYQALYQQATRCRLKTQWTHDDYADIESTDDEATTYDEATRVGTQVKIAPILDRVVISYMLLLMSSSS